MRILPPDVHLGIDVGTVAIFALAPAVLGLTGSAAGLAWLLAVVHLAMTLLTRFSPTSARPLPLPLHGAVEGVVGAALLVVPSALRWPRTAGLFYAVMGAVILAMWATTQYRAEPARRPSAGG